MGFLTVNTMDERTMLKISGIKEVQKLPMEYFELKYGQYNLKAFGPGLETKKSSVAIDRQKTSTIDINLDFKSRSKALKYSLMFPGGGQFYAGSKSRTRGLIYAATVLGGTGALLSTGITNYFDEQKLLDQYQINYQNATSSEDIDASWLLYEQQSVTVNDAQTNMMILGTTLASAWLTSIIDAYFFQVLMITRLPYLVFIILLFLSCEDTVPIRDNPLDEDGGEYIPPTISLMDISDGDTLYSESIEFIWEGNELVAEFRYKLDSFSWTDWNESSSATLSYLDEGNHQLSVQSRYLNGDTSDVVSVSFVVDAVAGPSLMFYPRRHFAQAGETVTFQVMAEEVTNLMMSEIHLEYDPSVLEIMSISQGNFFQNGQNSIFYMRSILKQVLYK